MDRLLFTHHRAELGFGKNGNAEGAGAVVLTAGIFAGDDVVGFGADAAADAAAVCENQRLRLRTRKVRQGARENEGFPRKSAGCLR